MTIGEKRHDFCAILFSASLSKEKGHALGWGSPNTYRNNVVEKQTLLAVSYYGNMPNNWRQWPVLLPYSFPLTFVDSLLISHGASPHPTPPWQPPPAKKQSQIEKEN